MLGFEEAVSPFGRGNFGAFVGDGTLFAHVPAIVDMRLAFQGSAGNLLQIWDVREKRAREPVELFNVIFGTAGHPLSPVVAASGPDHLELVDLASGRMTTLEDPNDQRAFSLEWGLSFTPDGRTLASAGRGAIRLWDVDTAKLTRSIRVRGASPRARPGVVKFGPDGKLLVNAMFGDHTLQLFDASTGEPLATFETENVEDFSIHPGGTIIATSSRDGFVRLWDARLRPPDSRFYADRADRYDLSGPEVEPRSMANLYFGDSLSLAPRTNLSHTAILRRDDLDVIQRGHALFQNYFWAKNWRSAAEVLRALPKERTGANRARLVDALTNVAAMIREQQPRLAAVWEELAKEFR